MWIFKKRTVKAIRLVTALLVALMLLLSRGEDTGVETLLPGSSRLPPNLPCATVHTSMHQL